MRIGTRLNTEFENMAKDLWLFPTLHTGENCK